VNLDNFVISRTATRLIELEDEGQDFTAFAINANRIIVAALPFQTSVWKDYAIVQKTLRPGIHLQLLKNGKVLRLRYAVTKISPINWKTADSQPSTSTPSPTHRAERGQ
jgi:hypothetical protein